MKIKKAKIYISDLDNYNYFNNRLPTRRWGFCYIERSVLDAKFSEEYHCYVGKILCQNAEGGSLVVFADGDINDSKIEWTIF